MIKTSTAIGDRDNVITPSDFVLQQNYPNPFNPSTQRRYLLAEASTVSIEVYDLLVQKVRTLINKKQTIGQHTAQWNGLDKHGCKAVSSAHFYRMTAPAQCQDFSQTRKMVLIQ